MDYTDFLLVCGVLMFAYQIHVLCDEPSTFRFKDKSFPNVTLVYGLNVTCDMEKQKPGNFPSQTWTCTDMRVNGSRMAYGYYPNFIGVTNKCTETRGFDELGEVCRAMMRGIDVTKDLWVAYASNAKCDFIDEMRLMLNMTKTGYRWDVMKAGYGWIETLQCMAIR
ncbi:hypothetical protein CHS0354_005809 [Potamilus streckersoni]|uniref:Uncharacterized protein n=1 Tax=Potamilus streckersoni TaxID=2493646 RepID=A0AAE0W1F3_9BIVA|nr:hypothetical protein CHS0354_005809 [Potamilus streckersoni]